jgi:hypothetical protein
MIVYMLHSLTVTRVYVLAQWWHLARAEDDDDDDGGDDVGGDDESWLRLNSSSHYNILQVFITTTVLRYVAHIFYLF